MTDGAKEIAPFRKCYLEYSEYPCSIQTTRITQPRTALERLGRAPDFVVCLFVFLDEGE